MGPRNAIALFLLTILLGSACSEELSVPPGPVDTPVVDAHLLYTGTCTEPSATPVAPPQPLITCSVNAETRKVRVHWPELGVDGHYLESGGYSPDGRYLTTRRSIYLELIDTQTGENRPLLQGFRGSHSARWSPSGDALIVSGERGSELYHLFLAGPDGSNPRDMTGHGATPLHWSADGERFYYVTYPPGMMEPNAYMMHRDGSHTCPVTTRRLQADFSRVDSTGQRLGYLSPRENLGEGEYWLWIAPLDRPSGCATDIRTDRAVMPASGFDWSPDGAWLAVTAKDALLVVRAGARTGRTIYRAPEKRLARPNWSADARWIAFVEHDEATPGPQSHESNAGRTSPPWDEHNPVIRLISWDGTESYVVGPGLNPMWLGETTRPAGGPR